MRTRRSTTLAAATMTLLSPLFAVLTPAIGTGTTFISFDDLPSVCHFADANPLRGHYAAAKFKGPNAQDGGAVLDSTCGGWAVPARTGQRFLAFNVDGTMANGGTARGPAKIGLTAPQKKVTIWVNQVSNSGTSTFKMVGRREGKPIRTATTTTSSNSWMSLSVSAPKGFDKVILSAPVEADGTWLADDLTMVN